MDGHEASVTDLVRAASEGDQAAWDELVERFTPLIMSVTRQHRLSAEDGADVGQTVWLKCVQYLPRLREPAALPGWIRTTTRHQCLQVLRNRVRIDGSHDPGELAANEPEPDSGLLEAERHAALIEAFAELSASHRALLQLLLHDPPLSYEQISQQLGIPTGSIGPTRARALNRLRASAAIAAQASTHHQEGDQRGITIRR